MPRTDDADERDALLNLMEEALDAGLAPEGWRALLRDLAARDDAGELLRRVNHSAETSTILRQAFDAAPVPAGLADGIKALLRRNWQQRPAARRGIQRLSFDDLDQIAAAGTHPPFPNSADE